MNSEVARSLEAQYGSLVRLVDAPTGALAYGTDLSCVTDLDPTLAEVDPASPRAISQAVIRRYTTPRSGLADDPDYGLDTRAHLNRAITTRDLRALSGALQGEAQKDDRVLEAHVSLTATLGKPDVLIAVEIKPADPAVDDFDFTFAVTSGDVLGVTINA